MATKPGERLMVAGFRQTTLDKNAERFGGLEIDGGRDGFAGICPVDRKELGVELGEVVRMVRDSVDSEIGADVVIVPGRIAVVSLSKTARDRLGLKKFQSLDGPEQRVGSVVDLRRDGDVIVATLVEEIADESIKALDDYDQFMRGRTTP